VAAFERFNEIYRLPRAVHIDHEIMRLLQAQVSPNVWPSRWFLRQYRWFGADGDELSRPRRRPPSGWSGLPVLPAGSSGRSTGDVRTTASRCRGWVAEGLTDEVDGMTCDRPPGGQSGQLAPTD
jgi:hypothetical protein